MSIGLWSWFFARRVNTGRNRAGKEQMVIFGKMILFAMKRINTFIIVLLSVCFTACKQPVPSGMEKAFGCAVGKTTLEEFCGLFPEDSYEWGLSWNSPGIGFMGIQPNEVLSVILKEGSYRGTAYQRIGMNFENRVLSDISFHVCGGAEKIDPLITFFSGRNSHNTMITIWRRRHLWREWIIFRSSSTMD